MDDSGERRTTSFFYHNARVRKAGASKSSRSLPVRFATDGRTNVLHHDLTSFGSSDGVKQRNRVFFLTSRIELSPLLMLIWQQKIARIKKYSQSKMVYFLPTVCNLQTFRMNQTSLTYRRMHRADTRFCIHFLILLRLTASVLKCDYKTNYS